MIRNVSLALALWGLQRYFACSATSLMGSHLAAVRQNLLENRTYCQNICYRKKSSDILNYTRKLETKYYFLFSCNHNFNRIPKIIINTVCFLAVPTTTQNVIKEICFPKNRQFHTSSKILFTILPSPKT